MLLFRMLLHVIRVNNWLLFWVSSSFILFSTLFIVYLEPATFPTVFEGLWWVMTTVTTVGYGDYFPVTNAGRVFAIFLYIFGIGLIGVVIGKVVDWFANIRRKREEGTMNYKGKNHVIIVGWSQKSKYAIDEILDSEMNSDVVIIDDLEKAPLLSDRVHYVRGNASRKATLEQANVLSARAVIIFTDELIQDSALSDGKTLIIASSIESYAPKVHTTVEVLEEEHVKNFKFINVNEVVLSQETISRLAVRAAFTKGISAVYSQLLSRSHGDDLYSIKLRTNWKTYRDAFEELLKEGATLVANRDQMDINRRLDENIPNDAELYVICDKNTYQKLK